MKNFPTISNLAHGANYTLKHGRPYHCSTRDVNWNNGDRVIAAIRVINGEDITVVANAVGCCVQSVRNWIKTLDTNNPRLDG